MITPEMRGRVVDSAREVLPRYPWAKAAYLFGSATRSSRPARDLDLGIVAEPIPLPFPGEVRVAEEIAHDAALPVPVDARILNGASPRFLNQVLKDGTLIYEQDREARVRFEVQAMSLWLDFRPTWIRVRREVLLRWADG